MAIKDISQRVSFILIIFLLLLLQCPVFAQPLVKDTLTVSFKGFDKIVSEAVIDTLIDQRGEDPRLIGKYEKNKYFFVPVDLLIYTEDPLSNEIYGTIQTPTRRNHSPHFTLIINEFELTKKTNSLLLPRYLLYSSFQIYQNNANGESDYIGQLSYESMLRKPFFGDKLRKGFESVMHIWRKDFISDLDKLSNCLETRQKPVLENLRLGPYNAKPVNMIIGVDMSIGTKSWMTDGEICFSHREVKRRFFRSGYSIRYRDMEAFDSIEFGFSNDYLFYRYRPNMIFRGNSRLLYGFNRWNDIETTDHEIWDAFILDYSLSQSLIYNPLDKESVIFGLGLLENLYYVHSQGIRFQLGILVNLGLKL